MAQPVWVLSVDLQTKTATFTSGLADAAKSANGSFSEIKTGAQGMGKEVGFSTMEARHGVTLPGEEFGVHLPRALTTFISSLGPIGAAMSAAFPFLAIAVGATLLLEHLAKLKAEGEKLTESQVQFGTTVANVLNGLDDKLLQAGIRTDELNGNHLAALNRQLQLIDHQSMNELVQAFNTVAKAADSTFALMQSHWYSWQVGSDGAKASLERFKTQYESLLAQKDEAGAQKLLEDTIAREEKILALKKQGNSAQARPDDGQKGDYAKYGEARLALQKMGLDLDKVDLASQQTLVAALEAQATAVQKVNALKAAEGRNASQTANAAVEGDEDKVLRAQAQAAKAAMDEADKLWHDNYTRAVSALQENERQKIDATREGSAARLAAIDSAIKEENGKGLQETGFYKSLLTDRVNTARQIAEEELRLNQEAGKIDAEHSVAMGELKIAAEKNADLLANSSHYVSLQQRVAQETKLENEEFQLKQNAINKEMAALDRSDKNYDNKLRQLQNKELQLVRQHENQKTLIKTQAEEQRNQRILTSEQALENQIAKSLTSSIMRQQSFGAMMASIGNMVVTGMLTSLLELETVDGKKRLSDARTAGSHAYKWGWEHGGHAAPILSHVLGAAAFAAAMAFETGGIVPGVERGDVVPAKLTPGEAVIPKAMTEKLSRAADPDANKPNTHVHVHAQYHISAVDGASVKGMLEKHADTFERHFNNTVRKMNR